VDISVDLLAVEAAAAKAAAATPTKEGKHVSNKMKLYSWLL
jgi:hypothetical protein